MIHTKEEYKTALYKAAEHAESWNTKAKSMCNSNFACHQTNYQ